MEPEFKVFVVDDDADICQIIKTLCQSEGLHVEIYHSALRFLTDYDPEQPGCLILDVKMPDMDGLELQAKLIERKIPIPIIFVSGQSTVAMAVQATKRGAFDFLEKPFENRVLLDRIKQALSTAALIREEQLRFKEIQGQFERLTRRELQVLDLMVEGRTTKQIGLELNISIKTVDFHRMNFMQKLQVNSLAQLVQMRLMFIHQHNNPEKS